MQNTKTKKAYLFDALEKLEATQFTRRQITNILNETYLPDELPTNYGFALGSVYGYLCTATKRDPRYLVSVAWNTWELRVVEPEPVKELTIEEKGLNVIRKLARKYDTPKNTYHGVPVTVVTARLSDFQNHTDYVMGYIDAFYQHVPPYVEERLSSGTFMQVTIKEPVWVHKETLEVAPCHRLLFHLRPTILVTS